MQVYPSSWDTLLKAKTFTQSPPFARLSFTSSGALIDWDRTYVWRQVRANTRHISAATKANGALIVMGYYTSNGRIEEGECASVATLIGADNTTTGWDDSGIASAQLATVCNVGSDLYCVAAYLSDAASTGWVRLYESPSGNGGDWSLKATIKAFNQALPAGTFADDIDVWGVSGILVTADGSWIVTHPCRDNATGGWPQSGVSRSTDDGDTWTLEGAWQDGASGAYTSNVTRNPTQLDDDDIWMSDLDLYGRYRRHFRRSQDDGDTWAEVYYIDNEVWRDAAHFEDDGVTLEAFRVGSVDVNDIARNATPATSSGWTQAENLSHAGAQVYTCVIDGYRLFFAGDDVMGLGSTLCLEVPTIKRVSIAREKGQSSEAVVVIDNQDGYYSRDLGNDDPGDLNEWHDVILPGADCYIEWGYGSDLLRAYTGKCGRVIRHRDSRMAELEIPILGMLQWRGKQLVVDGSSNTVGKLTTTTIEDAFETVAQWAGWSAGEIHADATGVLLSEIPYENIRVYDFLKMLADWVDYDLYDDEFGHVYMQYKSDRSPAISGLKFTLNGTTAVDISDTTDDDSVTTGTAPLVASSDTVTDITGVTTYVRDTDYTITQGDGDTEATLVRIALGSIGDGEQVLVSYAYAGWIFEPPYIRNLDYDEDPEELYRQILVVSTDSNGDEITGTYNYPNADEYGLGADLILRIPVPGPATQQDVDDYAAYRGAVMAATVRGFVATVEPWPCQLQLGDVTQAIEAASTMDELYRLDGYHAVMDRNGFRAEIEAHHYGYAAAPS